VSFECHHFTFCLWTGCQQTALSSSKWLETLLKYEDVVWRLVFVRCELAFWLFCLMYFTLFNWLVISVCFTLESSYYMMLSVLSQLLPLSHILILFLSPAQLFITLYLLFLSSEHLTYPQTVVLQYVYARAWNCLPLETRACSSLLTFRRETKSHLFRQSYGWPGAVYSDGQQTSALSCATVLYLDFVKCPHNCVMAALSSMTFVVVVYNCFSVIWNCIWLFVFIILMF